MITTTKSFCAVLPLAVVLCSAPVRADKLGDFKRAVAAAGSIPMTTPSEEARAAAGLLEAAFPKVKLDPKSAIGNAKATFLDYQAFAKGSDGRDWSQLDWEYLELNREAIGFLTPKGLADYLPAFLSAAIVHYDEVDVLPTFIAAGLTRRADEPARLARFDELVGYLDETQQKAVATALAELHRLAGNPHPEAVTKVALDSYWRKLLPKMGSTRITVGLWTRFWVAEAGTPRRS